MRPLAAGALAQPLAAGLRGPAALQRDAEWVATGAVTLAVPDDFPTADAARRRPFTD